MTTSPELKLEPWPVLSYAEFAATQHLLHMSLQAVGKLKLTEPFEPQWSEVPLWLTATGLTTGPIPYSGGAFEVKANFVAHRVECATSWGARGDFALEPRSVAEFVRELLQTLEKAGVRTTINLKPQEVANPVAFDKDTEQRPYDAGLVNAWWRILVSTQRVMQKFHGRFLGKTQPIGLMWGTLDIREVRYNGKSASPGEKADYIRRNAMNEELIEVGWWSGSGAYPKAAFYSFTYPQPKGIEAEQVSPAGARWEAGMGEFLLDYDDLRKAGDPDAALLGFFESTYAAGAKCAGWDGKLIGSGKPK